MHKHRKWIVVALAVIILRCGIGPGMVGAQMITGAFEPGGNCGNDRFPVPNTDLISWISSGGATAIFEEACTTHDGCYGTLGKSKSTCDWVFWQDMRTGCQETYRALDVPRLPSQIGQFGCELQAEMYFIVVANPLLILTYCNEQYYTRAGSRERTPDPFTALDSCGQER